MKIKLDLYILWLLIAVSIMSFFIFYRIEEKGYFYISSLGDIKEQYIHFFNLYHSMVRSGELPFWTWEFGPGGSFWNQFGYYILGDIFIWPLLLLPKGLFPYSFIPVSSLKLFLMALGIYLLLKKVGVKRGIALLAGLSYSFASLYFENFYTHYFFANPAVFFPFLLWGYEKYLSERKIWVFSTVFFICAISNFYFLFMITIGLFIYILFRFFTQDYIEKSIKGFWLFHLRLGLLYLLILGSAMIVFLPSVFGFLHSNAFVRPEKPEFDDVLTLKEMMRKLLWSGGLHFLPIIAIPLLFMNGKKNFIFGLMGLSVFLMILYQKINSMIGGFSLPSEFRAFFIYNAILNITAGVALNNINFKKAKNIIGLVLLSFVLYYWLDRNPFTHYGEYLKFLPLIFTFFFVLFVYLKKESLKKAMLFLCISTAAAYSFLIPYSFVTNLLLKSNGEETVGVHKEIWGIHPLMSKDDYDLTYQNNEIKSAVNYVKKDKSLYRIYLYDPGVTTHNSSMSYGYKSYYAYNSLLDWKLQKFEMDDLGQLGSRSLSMLRGYPFSTTLNTLFGNKYFVSFTGKGSNFYGYKTLKKQGNLVIEKNLNCLPFGFLYSNAMGEKEFEKMGFENQEEIMLKNAVIPNQVMKKFNFFSDKRLASLSLSDIKKDKIEKADKVTQTPNGLLVESAKSAIVIKLPVKSHRAGEMYAYANITPFTPNQGMTINLSTDTGMQLKLEKNMTVNQYITTQYHYKDTTNKVLFRLGQDQKTKMMTLVLQPGKFLIKDLEIKLGDYKTYENNVSTYKKSSLKNIEYGNNYLNGAVKANDKSVLFLSIPYSKGWSAYVDNKKTEIFPVHKVYSGIYIPKGDHTIKLKFIPEGFYPGLAVSIISLIILIVLRRKDII